ncbi:MAG TPA: hypothetical protein VFF36_17940, partial [Planctomycetota bacterium]|nr:hypothetical protein [Planctomycetota bacterium]
EDLLTDLSKIRGLKVASRNAVARYRGTRPEIATVGADLGVGAVLEGSVRRAGERVRITAQLIGTADGFQLWAERYDRTMDDVFAVQAEIAAAIAAALSVALAPGEIEELGKNRPQDVRAYDLYLRGRAEYGHYTRDSLEKARALFEEALRVDPGYALAWAGIADCWGQSMQWGYAEDRARATAEGLAAVERALAIEPRLVEAWKAKSLIHQFSGEKEEARAALRRALEIQPRFLPALINYGVELVREGDLAAAERCFRRAREIDPQEPFGLSWNVWVLWMTRREEEAMSLLPAYRALGDDPLYVAAVHSFRGWWQARQGDWAAVDACVREAVADGASAERLVSLSAVAAAGRGEAETARRLLRDVLEGGNPGAFGLILTAVAACRIGDMETAQQLAARTLLRELLPVIARLEV